MSHNNRGRGNYNNLRQQPQQRPPPQLPPEHAQQFNEWVHKMIQQGFLPPPNQLAAGQWQQGPLPRPVVPIPKPVIPTTLPIKKEPLPVPVDQQPTRHPLLQSLPFAQLNFLKGPFTVQLLNLLETIKPTESQEFLLSQTILNLHHALNLYFPKIEIHPFGSTVNGTWMKGNCDVDVCLVLDEKIKQQLEQEWKEKVLVLEQENEEIQKEWDIYKAEKALQQLSVEENDKEEIKVKNKETEKIEEAEEKKEEEGEKRRRKHRIPTFAQYFLQVLGEKLMNEQRFTEVKILTNTRIPIVKLFDSVTKVNVDIGYDNPLALINTRLIFSYTKICPLLRQLCLLIKYWAKQRAINDTYSGTLSSYAYVIMCLFFAVSSNLVPNLQQIHSDSQFLKTLLFKTKVPSDSNEQKSKILKTDHESYDVYFYEPPADMEMQMDLSLGEVVFLFFKYWAKEFEFRDHVASLRTGSCLSKEEKGWVPIIEKKTTPETPAGEVAATATEITEPPVKSPVETAAEQTDQSVKKQKLQRFWFCLEDPFELSHNLGRPVGRDSLYFIRGEFLRAFGLLGQNRGRDVVREIWEETKYKTRDEHKVRNRENMEFSERKKNKAGGAATSTGTTGTVTTSTGNK